ncbi:MAG: hypothetical protein AAF235_08410, partial [Planctomycetota bacterium]
VVGLPPQEDYYLGKATERLFLPLLKVLIPDILDYDLPMFGTFHNCALIQIKKHYPLHARRVMHAIWGAGQMAWTKTIFVVDETVDVHDTRAVLEACAAHCHPIRDVETVNGALDILDHAAPRLAAGVKMGFDCTPKVPGEEVGNIPLPDHQGGATARLRSDGWCEHAARIDGVLRAEMPEHAKGWGLIEVDRGFDEAAGAGLGRRVADAAAAIDPEGGPPFIIVVGRGVALDDPVDPFFHWLANSDPGRDAIRNGATLAFDATPKTPEDEGEAGPVRAWPPILEMQADVDQAAATRLASRPEFS